MRRMDGMLAVVAVCLMAGQGWAASEATAPVATEKTWHLGVHGWVEQFEWEEFFDGEKLLTESGPRVGGGVDFSFLLSGPLWAEGSGEAYVGEVDYDGGVQSSDGDWEPYRSDTSYSGMRAEGALALDAFAGRPVAVVPLAGLGFDAWKRSLDAPLLEEQGRYGYDEDWAVAYGWAGVRVRLSPREDLHLRGQFAVRLPLATGVDADLRNVGGPSSVTLEPDGRPSVRGDVSVQIAWFEIGAFYETLEFDASPVENYGGDVFQPESKARMAGVRAGLRW